MSMNMTAEQIKTLCASPMFKSMLGDDADAIAAQLDKDPAMLQQLLGFWKQLDNMADTDKKGYDEFVKK